MKTKELLEIRQKTHGEFDDVATAYCKILRELEKGVANLDPVKKLAVTMIVLKLVRISHGNPNEIDHWIDVVGYAQLVVDSMGGGDYR